VSKSNAPSGRPPATSRAELEAVALDLFADQGFERTTVDDIADAAGVSRRTFFRYYPSKNDVVWGAFDELLASMDHWLGAAPPSTPVLAAVAGAVVRFNSLPAGAVPEHRQRMALILRVPALQAHGTLRYADWRAVIARFVAGRLGTDPFAPIPQLVGHVSLAVSVAAYEQWLADPDADLAGLLQAGFATLGSGLDFDQLDGGDTAADGVGRGDTAGGRAAGAASPPSHLAEARSPDLDASHPVLLVPLGSVEQHGPHLPLDTDTRVAVAVAERAADDLRRRGHAIAVAPAIAYGSSGEHAAFAGTLSVGQIALEAQLVELGRSADHFAGMVIVNGHGGNVEALRRAVDRLRHEGRNVAGWSPRPAGGDAHAGRTETSLLLHLAPRSVRPDLAEAGNTAPLGELLADLRKGGLAAVTPNGVLGDPTGATPGEGEALLDALVADLSAVVHAVVDAVVDEASTCPPGGSGTTLPS
jgi:creatinine amidohydrolase